MAGMKSIDAAAGELEEATLQLNQLVASWRSMLPEDGEWPSWLWLLVNAESRVEATSQAYMAAVHEHARPLLADMERLSRSGVSGA